MNERKERKKENGEMEARMFRKKELIEKKGRKK